MRGNGYGLGVTDAARLLSRPSTPGRLAPPGTHDLGGALLRVPSGDGPFRLVVLLHGAGGKARAAMDLLAPHDESLALLAPSSRGGTWDLIAGGWGPDVRAIDAALAETFDGVPVSAVAVGGFSDGASYALSLGMANGDLVDAVVALSPGFAGPPAPVGAPARGVSFSERTWMSVR